VHVTDERLRRRRAIEALRSGVPPSPDVVAELGSGQRHVEQEFRDRLRRSVGTGSGGMLIGGGFGSGKSHLLHHFAGLALQDGFVTSRVVVSKGTPLHDPAKVVRTALDEAVMLGHGGPVVEQAAASLDVSGRRFARLVHWTASPAANLDRRFLASLLLYAELRDRDPEYAYALVRFWCGDPVRAPELRRRSRAIGRPFTFGRVSPRELAPQRLRFAPTCSPPPVPPAGCCCSTRSSWSGATRGCSGPGRTRRSPAGCAGCTAAAGPQCSLC
jgi:hypothetical protein